MALFLIRHPRPDVAPGVCYGRLDLGLAPDWASSLDPAALRQCLPAHIDRWISSPARRCTTLVGGWSKDFTTDPAWQELDFGAWEGRPWSSIDRAESDPWAEDVWQRSPPRGETYAALTARVRAAVRGLLPALEQDASDIVVVTHAGPMRAVRAWVEARDERVLPDVPVDYGGIWRFEAAALRRAVEGANRGVAP